MLRPEGEPREDVQIFAELTEAMGLIPKLPQWLYRAAEDAVLTGDRMSYFVKLLGWPAAGHLKYFDQLATVIALTLGKAYGSAARAISWAGMLTSPICGKSVVTVKADERKHPILTKLPMFKDWCQMDAAFELVDNHPEGAIIGMNDPDNMLKNHMSIIPVQSSFP